MRVELPLYVSDRQAYTVLGSLAQQKMRKVLGKIS